MQQRSLTSLSWRFRDLAKPRQWHDAVVPGCVHRDLLRNRLIPDPFWGANELKLQWIEERDWEYATTFQVTAEMLQENTVDLVCDGLDTVATVRLNGRVIGRSENMFVGHRWSIKQWLRPGRNELAIRFDSAMHYIRTHRLGHRPKEFNDPVGRCQVIRKQQCQFGWDWGPRFVTAGIWRDIRLEGWTGNRVESVRVTQTHGRGGSVVLSLTPELARPEPELKCHWRLSLSGKVVEEGTGRRIVVARAQLWWPNGHGAQPLYDLQVAVYRRNGSLVGEWSRRIGLRTIVLDRHRDRWGESFQFVVNGRPIFAKGANWIPAHSFVANLTRHDYARDLRSAVAGNMNMVRVWGGGIYESEDFYDLCDELGLLVWQDFMFACSIYPGDRVFLASVGAEAEYQVRRIRHRACLALWCGNNEIEGLNAELLGQPKLRRDYDALFHRTLPDVVGRCDGVTPYWPSSPYRPRGGNSHAAGEKSGDTHFWDVWHARHPVKDYEKWSFRFVSEFGMQSFSSAETQATFCPPENGNVFGATMTNHQKNRAGNQIILDYVSQRFPFPRHQDGLIYLSQLNQAYCMQIGVEHYRRLMPRCMGALYWQLNDCWPVASWSSIEFTGRWKALQFIAKRFFAPALVSAHVPGDETVTIGNYRRSDVHQVHFYTVYDAPAPSAGVLRWDLFHLDGRRLLHGKKAVRLKYGQSIKQKTLDVAAAISKYGRDSIYLRVALDIRGQCVSEDSAFLSPLRYLALPRCGTKIEVQMTTPRQAALTFRSAGFQHRFAFDVSGVRFSASDNYFDLYPQEEKSVTLQFDEPLSAAELRRRLVYRSLVDIDEPGPLATRNARVKKSPAR